MTTRDTLERLIVDSIPAGLVRAVAALVMSDDRFTPADCVRLRPLLERRAPLDVHHPVAQAALELSAWCRTDDDLHGRMLVTERLTDALRVLGDTDMGGDDGDTWLLVRRLADTLAPQPHHAAAGTP
jgi:hypothetical protein